MGFVQELNVVKKDWRRVDLTVALCYPNVYRAGMSGLTVRLLYALLNSREDVACERAFIPTLKEPWTSLESGQPLRKFDVVAFTLQYEEDYPNAIRMLLESGIPPRREDRKTGDPLVIAGGPCATSNPEPLADYIDLFVIGEAEPVLDQLVDEVKASKDPLEQIDEFADLKGVYVPRISNPTKRIWIRDLDEAPHPLAQQIPLADEKNPYMTIFGKAFAVEPVRGCSRGCRFCLIGRISCPKRERRLDKVKGIIEEGIRHTPVGKVSLIGASVFDYSGLEEVCEFIVSHRLELSIPSIRPETVTQTLAHLLAMGKQRSVTMAPDVASSRMRETVNKRMDEAALIDAAKTLLGCGIARLKLYFLVGLPGETPGDVEAIGDLSKRIADQGFGPRSVHLGVNPFVPKPHTPFERERTSSVSYVRESLRLLRKSLKGDRRFVVDSLDPRHARIQAFLSLGDRRIGRVIELVARYHGGLGAWRRALRESRISIEEYLGKKSVEEPLPWDTIDVSLIK